MLTPEQFTQITTAYAQGDKGLNEVIISLGLPLKDTLLELRDNHKTAIDEAKPK